MALYRIWPSTNGPSAQEDDDGGANGVALGMEFYVTIPSSVVKIHYWKASDVTNSLTRVGAIYLQSNGSQVSGTQTNFTDSGVGVWQTATLSSPVALTANTRYVVTVFFPTQAPTKLGYSTTAGYWTTGGAGASGITNGILVAPNNAGVSQPGQDSYRYNATIIMPNATFGSGNYWVDVSVEPVQQRIVSTRQAVTRASFY